MSEVDNKEENLSEEGQLLYMGKNSKTVCSEMKTITATNSLTKWWLKGLGSRLLIGVLGFKTKLLLLGTLARLNLSTLTPQRSGEKDMKKTLMTFLYLDEIRPIIRTVFFLTCL